MISAIRRLFEPQEVPPPPVEAKKLLPRARVAIVGAGIGGSLTARFLRKLPGGENLDIHIWQKPGSEVGGRAATIEFDGHVYECGASLFHSSNKHLMSFVTEFDLPTKGNEDGPIFPMGIYNGQDFLLRTSTWRIVNPFKMLWNYGLTTVRLGSFVQSTMKKFARIYDIQARGQAFTTVPDMLKAMGGEEMLEMTHIAADEYYTQRQGWSERVLQELVTGILRVNYGQSTKVDAFSAFVALAGADADNLKGVVGGNKLIAEKALEVSGATFHREEITSVTRVQINNKVVYTLNVEKDEKDTLPSEESNEYDVVILATPLNVSTIRFHDFPSPIYTAASTTPYQRVIVHFIKGRVNPSFFGLKDYGANFPHVVLTTEMENPPFAFLSLNMLVPSEVPRHQMRNFQKPVCEEPIRTWMVPAPDPLTDEQKQQMFLEIEDETKVEWFAYPVFELSQPKEFPPFVLDEGLFYINAIEKAASAMEMIAIGAKNVTLLTSNYLLKED